MTMLLRSTPEVSATPAKEIHPMVCQTMSTVHPKEHALFFEEVAAALNLSAAEVQELIQNGKLNRGVFIFKGFGWQPHFVSLLNLIEFAIGNVLKDKLAVQYYSISSVDEFLDEIDWWLEERDTLCLPPEMGNLLRWISTISLNAARELELWKLLGGVEKDQLILRAYYEWAKILE